ncbi:MAG TPA: hypothetical protein VLX90_10690 [Steroidobacteraceae bacterium]|nr:hypothetical protein [Steroidobacteraceae bacterium]
MMHEGRLVLPIENVGAGPAINVRGGAEAVGGGVITGSGRVLHPVEGLSAGRTNALVFDPSGEGNLEPKMQITMRLLYEDVAGITYATDLRYSVSAKAFQCAVIVPRTFARRSAKASSIAVARKFFAQRSLDRLDGCVPC